MVFQPVLGGNEVPVVSTTVPSGFTDFVESNGHLAIEEEHTSSCSEVGDVSYLTLSNHGRTTLSGMMLMPVLADTQPAGKSPVLQYYVYTFTNASKANVTLYKSPNLIQNGASRPLKYAIAFDDEPIKVVQFVAPDVNGNPPNIWNGTVSGVIWGLSCETSTTS